MGIKGGELMMFKVIGALAGLSIAAAFMASNAKATTYPVDATVPEASWLDTGIDASAGTTYDFTVINPATTWSAGPTASRTSTANGINPNTLIDGTGPGTYGQFTMLGYTFNYGALVGEDSNSFFLIGTGPTILTGLSGEIHVGYWDSNYSDNSGSQTLSIGAVPEASTWAMMLAGFAVLGFACYRRSRKTGTLLA
jgi:PEP-CTERM motif